MVGGVAIWWESSYLVTCNIVLHRIICLENAFLVVVSSEIPTKKLIVLKIYSFDASIRVLAGGTDVMTLKALTPIHSSTKAFFKFELLTFLFESSSRIRD